MKQDARLLLDRVRAKISPDAKVLVSWMEGNTLRCAQANLDQNDLMTISASLEANIKFDKFKVKHGTRVHNIHERTDLRF